MSAIFISHASEDRGAAETLRDRLTSGGHQSVFLDFDPEQGIPAGSSWEREIYRRLKQCRALVIVCSAHSMQSRWCFAEVAQARALGKPVFPVRIDACEIHELLRDRQVVDLKAEGDVAYERLLAGLDRAGLEHPQLFDWDPARPPYPGFPAFQAADASIYFGREREIAGGLEQLERMQRQGEPSCLVVLGASGSGKSSLVRAGMLPRLAKDPERWAPLPPFRPAPDPLGALASAFSLAFSNCGSERPASSLREVLSEPEGWRALAGEVASATGHAEATPILVIDQFEELLGSDRDASATAFLELLGAVAATRPSDLVVVATLRSDFLAAFQAAEPLSGLEFASLPVPQLERSRFPEVIEGPAERAGLEIEPGLAGRIAAEAETDDALPLLAFTLRELWERCRKGGQLTAQAYEELGGIQGAVARVANEIVTEGSLTPDAESALRRAFLAMVRVDEDGQFVRRPAPLDAVDALARPIVERMVRDRLLLVRSEDGREILEVAHEALFRVWSPLTQWLREERSFLVWRGRIAATASAWEERQRPADALLRGSELAEAERWRRQRGNALESRHDEFLRASLRRRTQRRAALTTGVVASLAVASALYVGMGRLSNEAEQSRSDADARLLAARAADLSTRGDSKSRVAALVLATRSLLSTPTPGGYRAWYGAAMDFPRREEYVSHAGANEILSSPDGTWLATGNGRELCLWRFDTRVKQGCVDPQSAHEFGLDPRGRWLVGADEATLYVWSLGDSEPQKLELPNPRRVGSLSFDKTGALLAVANASPNMPVFETEGWSIAATVDIEASARSATFHPAGPWLAVSSTKGLLLWSATEQAVFDRTSGGSDATLRFSPSGTLLSAGDQLFNLTLDGVPRFTDKTEPNRPGFRAGTEFGKGECSVAWNPAGVLRARLATADPEGGPRVRTWYTSPQRRHLVEKPPVVYQPDSCAPIAAIDGVWRYALDEGEETHRLETDTELAAFAVHPEEAWVVLGTSNGELRIVDVSNDLEGGWREHKRAALGEEPVKRIGFTSAGDRVIASTESRVISFELPALSQPIEFEVGNKPIQATRIAGGGRYLALMIGESSRQVRVLDAATGKLVRSVGSQGLREKNNLDGRIRDVRVEPGGSWVAIDVRKHHAPRTPRWHYLDLASGDPIGKPEEASSASRSPESSDATREIVDDLSVSIGSSALRVSEARSTVPVARFLRESETDATAARFSNDGRHLIAIAGSTLYAWSFDPEELRAEACRRLPYEVDAKTWAGLVPEIPHEPLCPE